MTGLHFSEGPLEDVWISGESKESLLKTRKIMTGSALSAVRCIMANLQGGKLERGSDRIASDGRPLDFRRKQRITT